MRCKSCDVNLTDAEAIRKSSVTSEYLDLCDRCLGTIADQIHESIDEDDSFWESMYDDDDMFVIDEHGEIPMKDDLYKI
jgi:hypothetical protein